MPNVTYHVLAEGEPFSEFHGGAISRWAGNVLRNTTSSVVVCPSADDTWKFPPESILSLSRLNRYRYIRGRLSRLPWFVHRPVLSYVFRPLLSRVRPGDIVWIHNRPEYAVALYAAEVTGKAPDAAADAATVHPLRPVQGRNPAGG